MELPPIRGVEGRGGGREEKAVARSYIPIRGDEGRGGGREENGVARSYHRYAGLTPAPVRMFGARQGGDEGAGSSLTSPPPPSNSYIIINLSRGCPSACLESD